MDATAQDDAGRILMPRARPESVRIDFGGLRPRPLTRRDLRQGCGPSGRFWPQRIATDLPQKVVALPAHLRQFRSLSEAPNWAGMADAGAAMGADGEAVGRPPASGHALRRRRQPASETIAMLASAWNGPKDEEIIG